MRTRTHSALLCASRGYGSAAVPSGSGRTSSTTGATVPVLTETVGFRVDDAFLTHPVDAADRLFLGGGLEAGSASTTTDAACRLMPSPIAWICAISTR